MVDNGCDGVRIGNMYRSFNALEIDKHCTE